MPVKVADRSFRSRASRAGDFIRDVRSELRKVVWPTRDEAIRLTAVVIGVSAAVGFFLGAVDAIFTQLFQLVLR